MFTIHVGYKKCYLHYYTSTSKYQNRFYLLLIINKINNKNTTIVKLEFELGLLAIYRSSGLGNNSANKLVPRYIMIIKN